MRFGYIQRTGNDSYYLIRKQELRGRFILIYIPRSSITLRLVTTKKI